MKYGLPDRPLVLWEWNRLTAFWDLMMKEYSSKQTHEDDSKAFWRVCFDNWQRCRDQANFLSTGFRPTKEKRWPQ